ncbi:MAG: hypothetical protein ABSD63_19310 [Candidatus Korobacteraceae bacterium]|jgi:hypothetical protein
MKHITRQIVADIINSRPTANFDTHWVERRVLRLHPVAFAEELLEFRTAADPLMSFSAEFSKWIGRTFTNGINKSTNGKVLSVHLGGEECGNQEWTKLNPGTPIS